MGDVGERAELALEAEERIAVRAEHGFERDYSLLFAVENLVDDAESSGAEASADFKAAGDDEGFGAHEGTSGEARGAAVSIRRTHISKMLGLNGLRRGAGFGRRIFGILWKRCASEGNGSGGRGEKRFRRSSGTLRLICIQANRRKFGRVSDE
jgi:hypothetical protein